LPENVCDGKCKCVTPDESQILVALVQQWLDDIRDGCFSLEYPSLLDEASQSEIGSSEGGAA
jgi:hypothetical protein